MKKLFIIPFLAATMHAATISATITYSFSTAVACSSTVTTNCMVNFQVGTLSGTTFTMIATAPLPTTLTGTVTLPAITFPFNGIYGSIQFAARVAAQDLNGNAIYSPFFSPSTAIVSVQPNAPTGLAVSATNP